MVDPLPPSKKSGLHLTSYILSWTSCFINPIIYCFTNKVRFITTSILKSSLHLTSYILSWTSCFINPIIYTASPSK